MQSSAVFLACVEPTWVPLNQKDSKRTIWELQRSSVFPLHLWFSNHKERAGAMVSLQPGGCDGTRLEGWTGYRMTMNNICGIPAECSKRFESEPHMTSSSLQTNQSYQAKRRKDGTSRQIHRQHSPTLRWWSPVFRLLPELLVCGVDTLGV